MNRVRVAVARSMVRGVLPALAATALWLVEPWVSWLAPPGHLAVALAQSRGWEWFSQLAFLLAVLWGAAFFARTRRDVVAASGILCPWCGYPMMRRRSNACCTECGRVAPAAEVWASWTFWLGHIPRPPP